MGPDQIQQWPGHSSTARHPPEDPRLGPAVLARRINDAPSVDAERKDQLTELFSDLRPFRPPDRASRSSRSCRKRRLLAVIPTTPIFARNRSECGILMPAEQGSDLLEASPADGLDPGCSMKFGRAQRRYPASLERSAGPMQPRFDVLGPSQTFLPLFAVLFSTYLIVVGAVLGWLRL